MSLTYSSYLKLDKVLTSQDVGPEHDEMLFVIIHQVYELWFKQTLHEVDYLKERLLRNEIPPAAHTLKRILTILKTMVLQIDILETMTPLDFLSFRDRLESGSGFQSYQFREFEFVLGAKNVEALSRYDGGSVGRERLEKRYAEPTLWDAFVHFVSANGFDVPVELLERDVTKPVVPSAGFQKALIDIYRTSPTVTQICERLIDYDEGIQEWRYRHVKMVERTIGTKRGTGGSEGAAYLKTTLFKPVFPDLWAIRTEL